MSEVCEVCLAIDVGGTKIRAALIDRAGQLLKAETCATDAMRGGKHVVATMLKLARRICDREIAGVGISAAGVIDPVAGVVVDATDAIPDWRGTKLAEVFKTEFAVPAYADNDVKCALLGEAWRGAAKEIRGTVVMLTLGTGLGGAIMHDGKILPGEHFLAGHFGRTLMWNAQTNAYVPLESIVSGSGIANIHAPIGTTGALSGEKIMTLARAGDANARHTITIWCEHLAVQCHNLCWMLDPARIIIGGGVIDSRDVWWPLLLDQLAALRVASEVVPATLGNDAGVFGAAKLVWSHHA